MHAKHTSEATFRKAGFGTLFAAIGLATAMLPVAARATVITPQPATHAVTPHLVAPSTPSAPPPSAPAATAPPTAPSQPVSSQSPVPVPSATPSVSQGAGRGGQAVPDAISGGDASGSGSDTQSDPGPEDGYDMTDGFSWWADMSLESGIWAAVMDEDLATMFADVMTGMYHEPLVEVVDPLGNLIPVCPCESTPVGPDGHPVYSLPPIELETNSTSDAHGSDAHGSDAHGSDAHDSGPAPSGYSCVNGNTRELNEDVEDVHVKTNGCK